MKKTFYIKIFALIFTALTLSNCNNNGDDIGPVNTGKGGSLARFAISGDYLYVVDNSRMNLFNINDPSHPMFQKEIYLGWGIETVHPYKNNLFIGSNTGMYIYNNSDPANPQEISRYEHIFSCDPVVVDDKYAYITLRNGSACRQGTNRLEIVDIQDLQNPHMIKSYDMENPFGLGIDGSNLFVCDNGLKVFDATNPLDLKLKNHFAIKAYDVIPSNGTLRVIGSGGLYQYNYSGTEIELLSKLTLPIE